MADAGNLNVGITASTEQFDAAIKQVTGELKDVAVQASDTSSALDDMSDKAGAAFQKITLAITAFATAAVYAAAKTDELRQALNNVGGDGNDQFQKFTVEANKLGIGIEAIAKAAIKLEASGISNETTRRLIDSVGEAVRKMGGGDQQFTSVINGLERIAATGVLTNRSLRQIEVTAPALHDAIEKAFGTDNVEKITALNLTTEQFMKKVADAAAGMTTHTRTIGDAFAALKNTVLESMGSLGDTLVKDLDLVTVFDKIGDAIKGVIKWFQSLDPEQRKTIELWAGLLVAAGAIVAILPILTGLFSPLGIAIISTTGLSADLIANWENLKIAGKYIEIILESLKVGFNEVVYIVRLTTQAFMVLLDVVTLTLTPLHQYAKAHSMVNDELLKSNMNGSIRIEQMQEELELTQKMKAGVMEIASAPAGGSTPENRAGAKKVTSGKNTEKSPEVQQRQDDVETIYKTYQKALADLDKYHLEILQRQMLQMGKSKQEIDAYSVWYLKHAQDTQHASIGLADNTYKSLEKLQEQNAKRTEISFKKEMDKLHATAQQFASAIKDGITSMATTFSEQIGNMFSGGNVKDAGQQLLGAMGSVMSSLGQMLISAGIGLDAIQQELEAGGLIGGWGAIAAGVALVAIGSMFSAGSKSIASGGGGSPSVSSASTGSAAAGPDGNLKALQSMISNSNQSQLTATVTGNQLAFVLAKSGNRSSN